MRPRRPWLAAGMVAAAMVLSSCTTTPTADQTASRDASDRAASSPTPSATSASAPSTPAPIRTVAENLDAPWSIAFDGSTALVSERDSGRLLELAADGTPGTGRPPRTAALCPARSCE